MIKTKRSSTRQSLLKKYGNTCQSCGITDVPLEVAHIIPLSEGGSIESDNITILCSYCHKLLDTFQPLEADFEYFLRKILNDNPDYTDVVAGRMIDGVARADLTTTRKLDERKQSLLIELKNQSFFRHRQLEQTITRINYLRSKASFEAAALVLPGRISSDDKAMLEAANIEVWDLDFVANTFSSEIQNLPLSGLKQFYTLVGASDALRTPSNLSMLIMRLEKCEPGKSNWANYQKLIKDIFEFLFSPPLGRPEWEKPDHHNANKRDIIFPNYANEDFWKFLRERYNADFIVVEAKNYVHKITKTQVLQVANYLKPHGAGMFAIVVCRKGGNTGCLTTIHEQWTVYKKLIILLDDEDIKAMLHAKSSRDKPEKVIVDVIQDFRLSM